MRLIQFSEPGPPGVLQCLEVPVPEPKSGEVLIRAHAIGVGIPDTLIRAGTYGHMPPLPATPGTEISGVVEKVGPSVVHIHVTTKGDPNSPDPRARHVPRIWQQQRLWPVVQLPKLFRFLRGIWRKLSAGHSTQAT